jgi:hypothetical protein
MSSGNEHIQIDFHNRAQLAFFNAYNAFLSASTSINRNENEFHFQQLKQSFTRTLEQRLILLAEELLLQYRAEKQSAELDLMLHQFIAGYLHRFVQKVDEY